MPKYHIQIFTVSSICSVLHNKHRGKRGKLYFYLSPTCCCLHLDNSYEIDLFPCFRGELLQVHYVLLACARAAVQFNVHISKHMNPSIALASFPLLGIPWFQIQNVTTDWLARDIVACCILFSRKASKSLTINEPLKGNITYSVSGWTHLYEVSECFLTSLLPVRSLKAKQRKAKNLP